MLEESVKLKMKFFISLKLRVLLSRAIIEYMLEEEFEL